MDTALISERGGEEGEPYAFDILWRKRRLFQGMGSAPREAVEGVVYETATDMRRTQSILSPEKALGVALQGSPRCSRCDLVEGVVVHCVGISEGKASEKRYGSGEVHAKTGTAGGASPGKGVGCVSVCASFLGLRSAGHICPGVVSWGGDGDD